MRYKLLTVALVAMVATGCSITREVRPVSTVASEREICLIEDPAVREGFLQTYRRELEARGFTVRMLPKGSAVDSCRLTSTYTGRWSWDLAIYLNYAEIVVYRDGAEAGKALYDGRAGGGRLDKFGSGEKRIAGLVNELFQ
ncbi:Sbal_3080 family lipoprotein [Lysobacter korlensis]|uniref:Sbal_3080 family lipoprotein n=1 Tax=Lysobacter korlensis TaxID=553636 RepID=A0ABV6RHS3_9GAMM